MEVFSLEDDGCNELFITQESKQKEECNVSENVGESGEFLGIDPFDFQSPCTSVHKSEATYQPQYSDVSDEESTSEMVIDKGSGR